MVKQKVVIGVCRHAESKSGLYFVLILLLHMILATFKSKHMTVLAGFDRFSVQRLGFMVTLGSQIIRNIRPCSLWRHKAVNKEDLTLALASYIPPVDCQAGTCSFPCVSSNFQHNNGTMRCPALVLGRSSLCSNLNSTIHFRKFSFFHFHHYWLYNNAS